MLQQFWSVWNYCTHMSMVFDDSFLAQGLHYKSPYTVPQPVAWMFLFLHMYSICEAQLYSLYFFVYL